MQQICNIIKANKPKTKYPYTRLDLFKELKIKPANNERVHSQKACDEIIKDHLDGMSNFGYDFWYSS